jgi:hypothetical protein
VRARSESSAGRLHRIESAAESLGGISPPQSEIGGEDLFPQVAPALGRDGSSRESEVVLNAVIPQGLSEMTHPRVFIPAVTRAARPTSRAEL